jgi:hypothetical protein
MYRRLKQMLINQALNSSAVQKTEKNSTAFGISATLGKASKDFP